MNLFNSRFGKMLISTLLFLTVNTTLHAQYSEIFSVPNKGYLLNLVDDFGGVNWTLSPWATAGGERDIADYFQTTAGGVLESIDLDQQVYWESPLLNISAAGTVSISVLLTWAGFDTDIAANNCSGDFIRVEYSINGGAYTMVPNQVGGNACATIAYPFGAVGAPFTASTTVNQGGISGNSLRIRVVVFTNANAEMVTIDNVSVPQAGVTLNCTQPVITTTLRNIVCNGASSGAIDVTATGATAPYNVSWTGPSSGNPAGTEIAASGGTYTIAGLTAGTYTITVTDAASCSQVTTATVISSPIVQSAITSPASCGQANGTIDLNVSGGNAPYTYLWSNSATTQDISGLAAGNYSVTITDASVPGCTSTASYTVAAALNGPYNETFSVPGKGYLINQVNNFFGVNWTMSPWTFDEPPTGIGRDNGDYFQTTALGKLEAVDTDMDVYWTSPELNISASGTVQFSVDLAWTGFDNEDYILVQYSINGGAFVTIPNQFGGGAGTIQYAFPSVDQNGSFTVTQTGITGNKIQIRIVVLTNSQADVAIIDNVSIPQTVSLCICPAITVINPVVTSGLVGVPFSQTFTQTGGAAPVNFTTVSLLPAGISLSAAGVLSGTPTVSGTFPIVVTATDVNTCTGNSSTYTLVINSCPAITVANPGLATATQLVPYSRSFIASGGTGPYSFTAAGSIPAGLSFTTSGLLHGTPTQTGLFPITVTATDANGCTGVSGVYNLNISAGVIGVARWVNNVAAPRPAQVAVNCLVYNTAPTTYTDIQTAINAAANGDVVYITEGTYNHTVVPGCSLGLASGNYITISGKTNLIITSNTGSWCSSTTTITGRGFAIVGGNNITIQGLTLVGVPVNAFYNSNAGTQTSNVTIKSNFVNGTYGHGIKTDDHPSDGVLNRSIWEITGNRFQFIGASNPGGCTLGPVSGIWLAQAGFNCNIIDNDIINTRWAGILCVGQGRDNAVASTEIATIMRNRIDITRDAGIQIGFSAGAFYYSNGVNISHNHIESGNLNNSPGIGGITILQNNIYGVNIHNNEVTNCFNGLAIEIAGWQNSPDTKNITNNNFYNLIPGSYGVTHIAGIAPNGLFGTADDLNLYNLRNNYWGTANGPTYATNPGGTGSGLLKETTLRGTSPTPAGIVYSLNDFVYTPFRTTPATSNFGVQCSSNYGVPGNTLALSSAVGTDAQTVCVSTPITNITYATTGATGATVTGLPAGVTGSWAANVVTISGSPTTTVGSPFTYTVTLTGGCGALTTTGTITVTPPTNTITRTSAVGTDIQWVCLNTPIIDITYATTGATGATITGLPPGVTGSWSANVVTITGTPTSTAGSPYIFTVTLSGGCGALTATGKITVNPTPDVNQPANQTVCNNAATTTVTFTGAAPGTEFNWTNSDPSIGLVASGTGNIASFTATNPGALPLTATITVTPSTPLGSIAYINRILSANVAVVNTSSNAIIGSAGLACQPFGTAFNPARDRLYVSHLCTTQLYVINTVTNTVVATINIGNSPEGIALLPDGSRLYVVNLLDGTVSIINTTTNTVVSTVPTGGSNPSGISITPDGLKAFIANRISNTVTVINTGTNTVTGTIPAGTNPTGISITPDGTKAYVTNNGGSNVTVINTATNAIIATIPVGTNPAGITITPDGTKAYVANYGSANVTVIDIATNTVITTVPAGTNPYGISVSPDGNQVCVLNFTSNNVTVISTATNTVAKTIGGIAAPQSLGNFIPFNVPSCTGASKTFTITVNPTNTVTRTSAVGTNAQTVLINTPITNITYATTGATGASVTGLPAGVSGSWSGNVVTISGSPTTAVGSPFNYTVTLTGGCGTITATGTITVTTCTTNSWTGVTSTDWFTATNWSCGTVPTATSDVAIPPGTPNTCTIGAGTAQVRNIGLTDTLINNGTLNLNGGGVLTNTGGTYMGTGNFTGALFNNTGGVVSPGNSPGCIVFAAGYTNGSGTEVIEIGGITPCTLHDQLQVTGTATLSGTLDVQLFGGYVPVGGESYTIMTSTTLVGTFATINYPSLSPGLAWGIQYNAPAAGNVTLNVIVLTPATALNFDGNSDFVSIPSTANNNFAFNQDFTVSVNVKAPATQVWTSNTDNDIVEKWSSAGGYPFVIRMFNQNAGANNGKVQVARFDGGNNPNILSTATINDNNWHQISFVKTGSTMYLYIDGILNGTVTDNTTGTTSNASPLFLGKRGGGAPFDNFFTGTLDELRIFNRGLCSGEIQNYLSCEVPTNLSGLVGYYRFNQGYVNGNNSTETTLTDLTVNANNGTLNTFALNGTTSNWTTGNATGSCPAYVPPSATATPASQTSCSGAPITTIVLSGATTYNWTRNNTGTVTGIAASGSGNISGTLTNTTAAPIMVTFTITPTSGSCTGTPVTATVVVNPTPDVNQPANQVVCNGAPTTAVNFTGTVAGTVFNWTNNTPSIGLAASGTGNIASFTATNAGTAPVVATVTVTPSTTSGGGGGPITQTFNYTGAMQTFTVPAGVTSLQLSALGASGGNSPGLGGLGGSAQGDLAVTPGQVLHIYVGGQGSGFGVGGFNGGGTGQWVNGGGGASDVRISLFTLTDRVLVAGGGGGMYTGGGGYLAGDGGGLTGTSGTTQNVSTTGGTQVAAGTPGTGGGLGQGQNSDAFFDGGGGGGGYYGGGAVSNSPYTGNGAGGGGSSYIGGVTAGVTTPGVNLGNGRVTITYSTGITCTGTPKTFTITVNPTPNATATPASQTICSGAAITTIVNSGTVPGTVYNWTRDNSGTVTGIAASGTGNISGSLTNTTNTPITVTFTVTPSYTNAGVTCTGTPVTATVLVNPTPNAVAAPTSQTICSVATITTIAITGNVAGTVYNWTRDNTVAVTGIPASGAGNISGALTNTTTAPVTVTFTITPTANGCPGTPITATVLVNPTPTAIATPASQTICSATPITTIVITGNAVAGVVYSWTRDNTGTVTGIAASGSGNISGALTNTTNTPITVTFAITPTANGCPGTPVTATVTVNPTPDVNQPANQVVCNGAPTAPVNFTGSVAGTVFNWVNNTPSIGLAASGTGNIASFNAINTGTAPVLATVTVTPSTTSGGSGAAKILLAFAEFSGATTTLLINQLLAIPGVTQVDYVNTTATTPSLVQMQVYDVVVALTNSAPTNPVLLGNNLADYIDGGGKVVATTFGWEPNFAAITGRWLSGGYAPFISSSNVFSTANLGIYTVGHPLMQGVTSLTAFYRALVSVAPGATQVAAWSDGSPLMAVKGNAVGLSAYIGNAGNWSGDFAKVIVNAGGPAGTTCTGTPKTFTYTVNPTPNATATPASQTICSSSAITTIVNSGAVAGTVYNWTRDNGIVTGIAASGTGNISGTLTNPTNLPITVTFTITPSYTNGGVTCSGTPITATVVVNPTPTVNAVANQVVCNGAPTTAVTFSGAVTAPPGTVYNWTNNTPSIGLVGAGSGNIASFTATNAGTAPVVATITVTPSYTNGGTTCNGTPITFTITVNPTPNATVTPAAQTICSGSAITTIVNSGTVAGTVFNWTRNNPVVTGIALSGTGNISGTLTNATNSPITVTFTVTPSYTNAGVTCTGASTTATVIVNPIPDVNQPANQVVCNGAPTAPVIFTGSVTSPPGTVYTWTNNNPLIGLAAGPLTGNIPSFNGINTGTAPVVATITVTPSYTNGGVTCTGSPKIFTITVNPTPQVTVPANATVCNGTLQPTGTYNFSTTATGGVTTYSWSNNNINIGLGGTGTGNSLPTFTATNATNAPITGTITVTATYTNGGVSCTGPSNSFTITVNPTPNATATPASQTICSGAAITTIVNSGTVAGTVFNWTRDNVATATGIAASGTGNISGTLTNTTTGPVLVTFTITPSYTNGGVTCTGPTTTATVLVNPTATVNPVANQVVCNGAPTAAVTFSSPTTGGTIVYNWTNSLPSIGLAAAGVGNIASFIATNPANTPVTATITVTPTYTNGGISCVGTPISFTITVNPTPEVNQPANQTVCTGSLTAPVLFVSTSVGGTVVFNWTNNNITIGLAAAGVGDIPAFTALNGTNAPNVGTITVTPVFTNGGVSCTGPSKTFTITVNPTPVVNPVANQTVCAGSPTAAVTFSSPATGGTIVYNWTNSNTAIGLVASGTGNIASFIATNATAAPITGTITVTATYTNNGVSCTGPSMNFTITVDPYVTVNPVANQTVCTGSPTAAITFSSPSSPVVFNWTNSNPTIGLAAAGVGNIASFIGLNGTNAPNVGTIVVTPTYTGGGASCPGVPLTFTITVNPIPVVNPVPNQAVCNGSPTSAVVFTSPTTGGTMTYNWTNSNTAIGLGASGVGPVPSFIGTNPGTAPISGTITVTPTYTNNGVSCTGSSISFTITVNPVPTVNPVANQVVCNGAPTAAIIFTGAVPGTVYNWINVGPNIGLGPNGTGNIPSFIASNPGTVPLTATITVIPTYTNAGVTCQGAPITFTITVNPTPTVNPVASQTHCNGSPTLPVTFSGTVAGTVFTWTNNNTSIGLGANGVGNIPSFIAINTGTTVQVATITVTPTYTNGGVSCTGPTTSFTITVNPIPTVNPVTSFRVCGGAPVTVNFTGAVTGTVFNWTNNNIAIGLAASGTGNLNFIATNTSAIPIFATITVTPTFTNGGVTCTGASTSFTITVNPTPTVNQQANQVLCTGSATAPITFTGTASGAFYTWTNNQPSIGLGAAGVGDIPSFTALNAGITPVVATVTVTPIFIAGGVTCTGPTMSFTITVNPNNTIVLTAGGTPASTTLTGQINNTDPTTNLRSFRDGVPKTCAVPGTCTAPLGGTFQYDILTWTNPMPTPQCVTVTYSIPNANPNFSFVAAYNGPVNLAALCTNWLGDPGSSVAVGNTIVWSFTAPGNANINFLVTNIANGQVADYRIVLDYLLPGGGSNNQTVCQFTPIVPIIYNTTGATGASFSGLPPGVSGNWAANVATISGTPTAVGVFNYTVNLMGGCGSVSATGTITVNSSAVMDQPGNQLVCNGANTSAVVFTGLPPGTTYSWTNNNTSIGLAASGTGNIPSFVATNATATVQTATITVTSNSTGCGGTTVSFTITVQPTPTVNQPANQTLCAGNTTVAVPFSGAVAGTVYTWTNNNTTIGLGASGIGTVPAFVAINATLSPITATITVTPTYTNAGITCTGASRSFTITVNPLPNIVFDNVPPRVCLTDTVVILKVSPAGGTWSGTGVTGNTFSATSAGLGVHVLRYSFTNGNGCTQTSYFNITVNDCKERHNIFATAIRIYPNPNSGYFNIRFNSDIYSEFNVRVIDAIGRVYRSQHITGLRYGSVIPMAMPELAAGTYFLEIYNETERAQFPMVIVR
ncbi:MAG: PKD-like domain-containing protein [Ferruginibacter sp.]